MAPETVLRFIEAIMPPDIREEAKNTKRGTFWTPHNHTCKSCGTTWHHDPVDTEKTIEEEHSIRAAEDAHKCPKCGREQWHCDDEGTTTPAFVNNGAVCKPVATEPVYQPNADADKMRWQLYLSRQAERLLGPKR